MSQITGFNGFKKRNIVFLVLTLIWAGVIFSFSSKAAQESSKESVRVGRLVCSIFVPGYSDMSDDKQLQMAEAIDYPVRKTAHGTEYAILGMLLTGTLYGALKINHMIPALLIGALYAASDEFHQLFVPGRSGNAVDVLIDSVGVLTGILIATLAIAGFRHRKHGCRR